MCWKAEVERPRPRRDIEVGSERLIYHRRISFRRRSSRRLPYYTAASYGNISLRSGSARGRRNLLKHAELLHSPLRGVSGSTRRGGGRALPMHDDGGTLTQVNHHCCWYTSCTTDSDRAGMEGSDNLSISYIPPSREPKERIPQQILLRDGALRRQQEVSLKGRAGSLPNWSIPSDGCPAGEVHNKSAYADGSLIHARCARRLAANAMNASSVLPHAILAALARILRPSIGNGKNASS